MAFKTPVDIPLSAEDIALIAKKARAKGMDIQDYIDSTIEGELIILAGLHDAVLKPFKEQKGKILKFIKKGEVDV